MQELLCYNRGCGKTFDPSNNSEESCAYHTGKPYFHDAYKSWTCCGKKTTNFTEFLSTPGCSKGMHSNVKEEEPKKEELKSQDASLVPKHRQPEVRRLDRPSWNNELTRLTPINKSTYQPSKQQNSKIVSSECIPEGESCKNSGCSQTYSLNLDDSNICLYHSGIAIFHEGLKYWSCCQKKTTDFQMFLNQVGCQEGAHKWISENNGKSEADCRYDWHQTGSSVTIAIYAKKYDSHISYVELNPIRCKVHLYFPESEETFCKDMELKGIIDVSKSSVQMLNTKVEILLKKAELGNWSQLEIPKTSVVSNTTKLLSSASEHEVDALNLDDLDFTPMVSTLSKEASGGRTNAEII